MSERDATHEDDGAAGFEPGAGGLSREEMLATFERVSGRPIGSLTAFRELTLGVMSRIWSRPGLPMRERRLITMAVLAASGARRELDVHVRAALASGDLDVDDLDEASMQIALYGGWPSGAGLQSVIAAVLEDPGPAPVDNRRRDGHPN